MPSLPKAIIALLFAWCLLPPAEAAGWRSEEPFLLQLDDQQYTLPVGSLTFSTQGHVTLQAPLQLSQCQRRNGASLLASAYRLIYDSLGRTIYLSSPILEVTGNVLRVQSSSGDLVCANATPANVIFSHSFD